MYQLKTVNLLIVSVASVLIVAVVSVVLLLGYYNGEHRKNERIRSNVDACRTIESDVGQASCIIVAAGGF